MPEDLEDKLDDFELMLEGFVSKCGVAEDDRGQLVCCAIGMRLKVRLRK